MTSRVDSMGYDIRMESVALISDYAGSVLCNDIWRYLVFVPSGADIVRAVEDDIKDNSHKGG